MFPCSVEEVVFFNCKHTTYHAVGTEWQVELTVKYSKESFYDEVKRLGELCHNSTVCGCHNILTRLLMHQYGNYIGCFEYAVANEEERTIGYIYLQLLNKDNLEISSCYIPHQYEMEMNDTPSYTLY